MVDIYQQFWFDLHVFARRLPLKTRVGPRLELDLRQVVIFAWSLEWWFGRSHLNHWWFRVALEKRWLLLWNRRSPTFCAHTDISAGWALLRYRRTSNRRDVSVGSRLLLFLQYLQLIENLVAFHRICAYLICQLKLQWLFPWLFIKSYLFWRY